MRVDIPTLQCDRCKTTTQNTGAMMLFNKLTHYHMSGHDDWDLCPACWKDFELFMENVKCSG